MLYALQAGGEKQAFLFSHSTSLNPGLAISPFLMISPPPPPLWSLTKSDNPFLPLPLPSTTEI